MENDVLHLYMKNGGSKVIIILTIERTSITTQSAFFLYLDCDKICSLEVCLHGWRGDLTAGETPLSISSTRTLAAERWEETVCLCLLQQIATISAYLWGNKVLCYLDAATQIPHL